MRVFWFVCLFLGHISLCNYSWNTLHTNQYMAYSIIQQSHVFLSLPLLTLTHTYNTLSPSPSLHSEDNCSWSNHLLGQRPVWNSRQAIHLQINRNVLTINFVQLLRAIQKRTEHTQLKKILRQNRNCHTFVVHLPRTGRTSITISRLFRGTATLQFKVLQKTDELSQALEEYRIWIR